MPNDHEQGKYLRCRRVHSLTLNHSAVELDPRIDLFAGSVAGTDTFECEPFFSESHT